MTYRPVIVAGLGGTNQPAAGALAEVKKCVLCKWHRINIRVFQFRDNNLPYISILSVLAVAVQLSFILSDLIISLLFCSDLAYITCVVYTRPVRNGYGGYCAVKTYLICDPHP